MSPRPGVFTRYDPAVLAAVDELARRRGVSRAEIIRGMVNDGIRAEHRRQQRRERTPK